ncbi:unnamed protein product, partial [Ilex paraguariensis]
MPFPKTKTSISSPPAPPVILQSYKTPSSTFPMLLIASLSDKVAKDIGLDLTSAYKEEHLIPLNLLIIARFSLPSKLVLIGICRLSRRLSK